MLKKIKIKAFVMSVMIILTALPTLALGTVISDYPSFVEKDGTINAFIVVGESAASSDVVSAIDLALRLPELTKTEETVTVPIYEGLAVNGVEKDIGLSDPFTVFPENGILKTYHYNGLEDSTLTWRGTSFDYHEQVDISRVYMSHDIGVDKVNGSETMVIGSGSIVYEYIFDKEIDIFGNTGKGTLSDPNYDSPIEVELLDKKYLIVGTDSNLIKVLQGAVGTATDTIPLEYCVDGSCYKAYADLGSSDWVRITIKDENGNTIGTKIIDKGRSEDISGLTVKVLNIYAKIDGTIVGVPLVIGLVKTVEKTYDSSADVSSSGIESDRYPDTEDWGIQVSGFAPGKITLGSKIQVVYRPSSKQYLSANSAISLPNGYADLAFAGWNTDKFATVTVKPVVEMSLYNITDDLVASDLNGLEISSDISGTIQASTGSSYSKGYLLYDTSTGKVQTAFWDSVKQKRILDQTISLPSPVNVTFPLRYAGKSDEVYDLTFQFDSSLSNIINAVWVLDNSGQVAIIPDYRNKTADFKVRLGSSGSAESTDVKVVTEGTFHNVGKKTQEILTDSGVFLRNPENYADSDKVSFKIPAQRLKAKVYFGNATTTAQETELTTEKVVPTTTPIAKLDSEIIAADKQKPLILVGGPCANTLVKELVDAGKMGSEYSCVDGTAWTADTSYIMTIDDAFISGVPVIVVAGTHAKDTRAASQVLQKYEDLSAIETSAVKIVGDTITPI